MGYFTWKFADDRRKKLQYGGKGFIAMPDGTFVGESRYDGYGMFGDVDAYDAVVDMNKPYLSEIFDALERRRGKDFVGAELRKVAEAYSAGDDETLKTEVEALAERTPYLREEWKRNVGIAISCWDEDNSALPFPLKITSTDKPNKPYAELKPSVSTQ